jgi:hypothetical protein
VRLADLRRLAVRKQLSISFRLRNGLECVVNRDGVAQVPGLNTVPDFNLEDELAAAGDFRIEPAPPGQPGSIARAEMMQMAAASPLAAASHEHEDE